MMNQIFALFALMMLLSCSGPNNGSAPIQKNDWKARKAAVSNFDSYYQGQTYLPLYSDIYHRKEQQKFNLTTTVSIRNVSSVDTIYLQRADFYNTEGENIRQYIQSPVYIDPLETIEIVIAELDVEGGTGANFLFDWATRNEKNPLLVDAVMTSSYGPQGMAFTTRGVQVFDND